MLEIILALHNQQVSVNVGRVKSHQFSLLELVQSEKQWKEFFENPRPYGSRLLQALFKDGSAAKTALDELSKQMVRTIVLVLDSPELDSVAWEYAYNEVKQEYLVEECAFMRALPESERPANDRLQESVERVSLLFIPANPLVDLKAEPMRALDVDGEWREMTRHITASNAPFDLLQLRPATPEQLQTSMARFRDGLVVHFSGHGAAMKDGTILLFERENGASNPLGAQDFIRAVKDTARIVFLSACQSAAAEKTEFGNLARGLVKSGVPFALGMQFNLPDPFAPVISGQFYNWLAQGHAIPEATMQARRAVKRENEFFVGMIALYVAHPHETGKLEWRGSGASLVQMVRPADVSDLPSPANGLIGRQRELMNIGTKLLEKKKPNTVTLHGTGGIGKTALLWQSLLRFAPSFDLTLALALDPLPSLESILGRIERFLGLPSPCANETKERETLVRERLTSKRTLLGLDNFETLNYALNEKGSNEEKTSKSLYAFFKSLSANGVTLCVTSREKISLPGETIQEIHGLDDHMGGELFYESVSTRKDALSEVGLEKLSAAISGHPLALRLLAPIFEEQAGLSLEQFIVKIQTFLPNANDRWGEQERHESLGTCFAFSMDNLSRTKEGNELQGALSKLSIFIAYFFEFTAMPVLENGFPENMEEQGDARIRTKNVLHALWEHGLLERMVMPLVGENFYLYRLHPALSFFAREQLPKDQLDSIQKNYYYSLDNLVFETSHNLDKSTVAAQATYYALPDLKFYSKIIKGEEGATLSFAVALFLNRFGLLDEALNLLNHSLSLAVEGNLPKRKSMALHEIASIYFTRGSLDEAMKLYEQAFEIFEKLGETQSANATLHNMAEIFFTRGNLDKAMALHQQSLNSKVERGDVYGRAATLYEMAGIYDTRGDSEMAMNLYQQSFNIFDELGNLRSKAIVQSAIAHILASRRQLDDAMRLYNQSLELFIGLGDVNNQSSTLHAMAIILRDRGELKEAMRLYEEAFTLSENLGNLITKSNLLTEMADIYITYGDLGKAMELCSQSLKLKENLGDLQGKSHVLNSLADIYKIYGDLDKALQYYQNALATSEDIGYLRGKSISLVGLAQIYEKQGSLVKALELFDQSLEIKEKLGDLHGKHVILAEMASIHGELGELEIATQLFKQCLEILEKIGTAMDQAAVFNNIAIVFFKNSKFSTAIYYFMESLMLYKKDDSTKNVLRIANTLIKIRQSFGPLAFDSFWLKEIKYPLPDWLVSSDGLSPLTEL